jgi:hypothetical protein
MMVVAELVQTLAARPSQWEGLLDDGRHVYVRFRYGRLQVGVGSTLEDAVTDDDTYNRQITHPFDGILTYQGLIDATADLFTWPTEDKVTMRNLKPP